MVRNLRTHWRGNLLIFVGGLEKEEKEERGQEEKTYNHQHDVGEKQAVSLV